MRPLLDRIRAIRHPWISFSAGLLIFVLGSMLVGGPFVAPESGVHGLDLGYATQIAAGSGHEVLSGRPHPFGERLLVRVLLSVVSQFTGDSARAGVLISTFALIATLGAMFPIARSVFPSRGFHLATLCAFALCGPLQMSWNSDPSVMLGMALIAWGLALFLSVLFGAGTGRAVLSATCFAAAAWLYLPLAFLWLVLGVYLIVHHSTLSSPRSVAVPALSIWVAGFALIAIAVWPIIHRNMLMMGSPLLPAADSRIILGAASAPLSGVSVAETSDGVFSQLWRQQTAESGGMGVFLLLLFPFGLVLSCMDARRKAMPWFWLFFVSGLLLLLLLSEPVVGVQGVRDMTAMCTPFFLPFAVLVPAYGLFHWLQTHRMKHGSVIGWAVVVLLAVLMSLLPQLFIPTAEPADEQSTAALFELLQEPAYRDQFILSDDPGLLIAAGRGGVVGMGGQTERDILLCKYADASWNWAELFAYLRQHQINLIHLSQIENAMFADRLKMAADAPVLQPVTALAGSHRVFELVWP